MVDTPGGASGLLVRDDRGKKADRLVTRIDPGVASRVAELRGRERQAAEELEQWTTGVKEQMPLDASAAPITRAMISSVASPAGRGSKPMLTGFESETAHYDQRGLQKPILTFNDLLKLFRLEVETKAGSKSQAPAFSGQRAAGRPQPGPA
jgi:hypothetical protein